MTSLRVVICVLLAGLFHSASGLYCYSCSATLGQNNGCENLWYSSVNYNSCIYQDAICAKYVIEYGDSVMIHRGCQHQDICGVIVQNNPYQRVLDCQTCNSNYCNASAVPKQLVILTLLSTILIFIKLS